MPFSFSNVHFSGLFFSPKSHSLSVYVCVEMMDEFSTTGHGIPTEMTHSMPKNMLIQML